MLSSLRFTRRGQSSAAKPVLVSSSSSSSFGSRLGGVMATPSRTMATEAQLKRRIRSVTSIQKITKAMKTVAASKLRGVQNQLEIVRVFHSTISDVWPEPETKEVPRRHLLVPLTSDRGLCGAINSSISRLVRDVVRESAEKGREPALFTIGEKGKNALDRLFRKYFTSTVTEAGKQNPVTFAECSLIAEHILATPHDQLELFYNRFKSAISFETTRVNMLSRELAVEEEEPLGAYFNYEDGKEEVLHNLYEYRLASTLFHMMFENATSEQSARMTAMDNSSKNASEMLDGLRLLYNRNRQARITTELIEIISGATAAEEQTKKK